MTSSDWQSTGRELWVFRAERPEDLLGVHANLIAAALTPCEQLRYLLYAPIWDGDTAPFGIHGQPASHAVAVTTQRFIISEDCHTEGSVPSVHTIPFDQVLSIEVGSALLLGWLALRFVEKDAVCQTALLYNAATGRHHFAAAVRAYRALAARHSGRHLSREDQMQWSEVWRHTARHQTGGLQSLIIDGERPLAMLRAVELWTTEKQWRKNVPVCLTTAGMFVATDSGFLSVTDEPAPRPHMLRFGVNVSCIAPDAVQSMTLREQHVHASSVRFLRVHMGRAAVATHVDIPFDDQSVAAAERLLRHRL